MEYKSVKSTAKRFQISERRVQKLCEENRIQGAQFLGNMWIIPENATKPHDARHTLVPYDSNLLSLKDFCTELSISDATGKNWIKLGKISPTTIINKAPFFTLDYINSIKQGLQSDTNSALKKRRNKKYVSGNSIYKSYISTSSPNTQSVQELLDNISINHLALSELEICLFVAECAIQLICQREKIKVTESSNLLYQYLTNELLLIQHRWLIDDLIGSYSNALHFIAKNINAFKISYYYEDNEDILGLLYISLKNISVRKASGAYYTPTNIVHKLIDNLYNTITSFGEKNILDPCCGTGNFLLQLPTECHISQVFGNDIDSTSIKITRINMSLKFQITDANILYNHFTEMDYLSKDLPICKYDYIIGNPPWGYNFSNNDKKSIQERFISAIGKNIESYDIFIEQALLHLNHNGILSFILPEAILNVKAHSPIRNTILNNNSIQLLEYLGNAFDKVQCPCIILQILHNNAPLTCIGMNVKDGNRSFKINTERSISSEYFNFITTDKEYQIIHKIARYENSVFLDNNADFALGIVTGDNKKFIVSSPSSGTEILLKGADIYKFKPKKSNNYIHFTPNAFQQVAPIEFYRAPEKLLYRFICNQLVFAYDNEQTLSLNSCNILIPHIETLNIKYILAILNSRIAQFIFMKQFNSVKVLRSHIEKINIPLITIEQQQEYIDLVEQLIDTTDEQLLIRIYEQLDDAIASLFHLSAEEYSIIRHTISNKNIFLC